MVVGVSGSADLRPVLEAGARLARALNAPLQAVHVETPQDAEPMRQSKVAENLAMAQEMGASVARIPAAGILEGLAEYARSAGAGQVVLGHGQRGSNRWWRQRSLADRWLAGGEPFELLVVPHASQPGTARRIGYSVRGALSEYGVALAAVAFTLLVAAVLRETTSVISTSILFLFPVIGVAARSGLGPTIFAVAASVVGHNLLFVQPAFALDALAVQSWIMAAVLMVSGSYTAILTSSLRGRVKLSDRSAQESASLASFAQRLTRLADWTSTGAAVCEEVGSMLDVETVIFREVGGKLTKVADHPPGAVLEPIDHVALEWVWQHGESAAAGSSAFQPGKWQFYPLSTSLGVLAALGVARPDGRAPVEADKLLLFSTLLAQASLAHERLKLEDRSRSDGSQPPSG